MFNMQQARFVYRLGGLYLVITIYVNLKSDAYDFDSGDRLQRLQLVLTSAACGK